MGMVGADFSWGRWKGFGFSQSLLRRSGWVVIGISSFFFYEMR